MMERNPRPNCCETEAAFLGNVLLEPEAASGVFEVLSSNDFYNHQNRMVYQAILDVNSQGGVPDLVTVVDHLNGTAGVSISEVTQLTEVIQVPSRLEKYARIIKDKSSARALDAALKEAQAAVASGDDTEQVATDLIGVITDAIQPSLGSSSIQVLSDSSPDLLDVDKCFAEAPPKAKWILEGLIAEGVVGIMNAQGGVGKSYLAVLIAILVAGGKSTAPFKVNTARKVLVINVEDSEEDIQRRLHAINQVYELTPEEKELVKRNLLILPGRGKIGPLMSLDAANPVRSKHATWLLSSLRNTNPGLVILDTKSRLFGLDENNNSHAAAWLSIFEEYIVEKPGCSFLILHHNNKMGSESTEQGGSRGASALIDNCRFNLVLKPMTQKEAEKYDVDPRDYFSLHNAKNNYSRKFEPVWFQKATGGVPIMADLKSHMLSAALDLLIELLIKDHGGEINQRFLIQRPEGTAIRQILKEQFGLTKGKIPELVRFGVESTRLEVFEGSESRAGKQPIFLRVRNSAAI